MVGHAGKIDGLLDLLDEQPAAVTYDWWARFHQSPRVIGTDLMPWSEAIALVQTLRSDPSSAIAAALEGWDRPVSTEALVLMDLFDLDITVNSKNRPELHPGRPYKQKSERRERHGNAAGRTPAQVLALLRPPV